MLGNTAESLKTLIIITNLETVHFDQQQKINRTSKTRFNLKPDFVKLKRIKATE